VFQSAVPLTGMRRGGGLRLHGARHPTLLCSTDHARPPARLKRLFILVPAGGGAAWLEAQSFRESHLVGVHVLSADATAAIPAESVSVLLLSPEVHELPDRPITRPATGAGRS